jgi:hypothetical protein
VFDNLKQVKMGEEINNLLNYALVKQLLFFAHQIVVFFVEKKNIFQI